MAPKQPKPEVEEPKAPEETKTEEVAPATESAQPETERDNGAGDGREPQVVKAPAKSFEERTGAGTPPWQRPDGSQDNGTETE